MSTITGATISLNDLAEQIRVGHETIGQHMCNALHIAFAVGNALIQAHAQVEPGQWIKWLRANCFLSRSSAALYVRLVERRAEVEERIAEFPNLSLRAAANLIAKPKATPKKNVPPRPKPTLQDAWNKAAPSERAAVLARMALNDLLQTLPLALRARFHPSGKPEAGADAADGEPFLKASKVLRRALSLLKTPSETDTNEALSALRLLNGLLADAGIDEVTIIRQHAKERRRAA
jgi:hypothetical protein